MGENKFPMNELFTNFQFESIIDVVGAAAKRNYSLELRNAHQRNTMCYYRMR